MKKIKIINFYQKQQRKLLYAGDRACLLSNTFVELSKSKKYNQEIFPQLIHFFIKNVN